MSMSVPCLMLWVASIQGDVGAWPKAFGADSVATLQRGSYFVYATNVSEERIEFRIFSVEDRKTIKSYQIPDAKFAISLDERWLFVYSPRHPRALDVLSLEDGKLHCRLVNGHKSKPAPLSADAPNFCIGSEGQFLYAQFLDNAPPQRWRISDVADTARKKKPTLEIPGEAWALRDLASINGDVFGEATARNAAGDLFFANLNRTGNGYSIIGQVLGGQYNSTCEYVSLADEKQKGMTLRSALLPEKAIFQIPFGKLYPECEVFSYPFSVSRVMLMILPGDEKVKVCFVDVVRRAANDIRCTRTEYELTEAPGLFQFRCRGWCSLGMDDGTQFFFPESEVENVIRQKAIRVRRYEHALPPVDP